MRKSNIIATAALLFTAVIWGLSYSAQAEAMKSMQALSFVFLRYVIGAAILLPAFFTGKRLNRKLLTGGIFCGIFLAGGEILQQFGLLYTTAGKAGFLTALYVIMIPLIGIFISLRSDWKIWLAAFVSMAGTYLLCSDGTLNSFGNPGDFLVLICALFFALQFIAIAKFAPDAPPLKLAAIEFITVAILSGIASFFAGETLSWTCITATAGPLLYCGVGAIGVASTIQIAAQKYVNAATSSIILSTASVFAVIWGWLLLGESYSCTNLICCVLICIAVLFVQLSQSKAVNGTETEDKGTAA